MDCLKDYIGIVGVEELKNPLSGFFINSLPGITLDSIDSIASKDQTTYRRVWDDVQMLAQRQLKQDLVSTLRSKYRLKTITRNNLELFFNNTYEVIVANPDELRGLYYKIGCTNLTYQAMEVSTLMVFAEQPDSTVHIEIWNNKGDKLWEYTRAGVSGRHVVHVDKIFFEEELFIGYSNMDSIRTTIPQKVVSCYCETVCCACGDDCTPQVYGATLADGVVTAADTTFGLSATLNIVCDYSSIICHNKSLFLMPYAYLCGFFIMQTRLHTNRVSFWTTIGKESAAELRDFYLAEYHRTLEEAVRGIELHTKNDYCIECNDNPQHITWRP
jgi:hypothetical protein